MNCLKSYLEATVFDFALLGIVKLVTGGGKHVILGKNLPQFPNFVSVHAAIGLTHQMYLLKIQK